MSNTRSTNRRDSVNQSLVSKLEEKHTKEGSLRPEKSPVTAENKPEKTKTKSSIVEGKSITNDFDKFKEEIKGFFQKYDEKLESRLTQFDKKFTSVFEEIKKDVNAMRVEMYDAKNELKELKDKVSSMEESMRFDSAEADDKFDDMKEIYNKQRAYLNELEEKLLYQEIHDRRYNLLFYGFPEVPDENLEVIMKNFFNKKLEIPKESVEAMLFANQHRVNSHSKGPRPIIVKFVCMSHRDMVFSKSLHPILREEKKRILSGLPIVMKKERGRLATHAYNIRQKEEIQTRIVEKGLSLYLEVRKDKKSAWERREVHEVPEPESE